VREGHGPLFFYPKNPTTYKICYVKSGWGKVWRTGSLPRMKRVSNCEGLIYRTGPNRNYLDPIPYPSEYQATLAKEPHVRCLASDQLGPNRELGSSPASKDGRQARLALLGKGGGGEHGRLGDQTETREAATHTKLPLFDARRLRLQL